MRAHTYTPDQDKDVSLGSLTEPYVKDNAESPAELAAAQQLLNSEIVQEEAANLDSLSAWYWAEGEDVVGGYNFPQGVFVCVM